MFASAKSVVATRCAAERGRNERQRSVSAVSDPFFRFRFRFAFEKRTLDWGFFYFCVNNPTVIGTARGAGRSGSEAVLRGSIAARIDSISF